MSEELAELPIHAREVHDKELRAFAGDTPGNCIRVLPADSPKYRVRCPDGVVRDSAGLLMSPFVSDEIPDGVDENGDVVRTSSSAQCTPLVEIAGYLIPWFAATPCGECGEPCGEHNEECALFGIVPEGAPEG